MRIFGFLSIALLTACGPVDRSSTMRNEPRIPPSVTEPGLHVSGDVRVGVVVSN